MALTVGYHGAFSRRFHTTGPTPLASTTSPMDVRLEVVHDNSRVRHVRLRRDTVVGRSKDCQLRIPVAAVSRRHCQFTLDGERLLLRDLGSSNGTQLGERTIPPGKDILLADGDTITVGPVSFVIHLSQLDDTPPADATPAPQQPAPLQDTAEFFTIDPVVEAETDVVTDDTSADAPAKTADIDITPQPTPDPTPQASAGEADEPITPHVDSVMDDDDPVSTEEASVVELELTSSVDLTAGDDELQPADPEVADSPEQPLKSRSLFGLFRRPAAAAEDKGVSDDDLMEEPGEDPPTEGVSDEPQDGSIAAGHPAAAQSNSFNDVSTDPTAEPIASDSVFDDDVQTEESLEHNSVDEEELEEIAEDGDSVSFDFLDDETKNGNDSAVDDGLNNFLGQFGK